MGSTNSLLPVIEVMRTNVFFSIINKFVRSSAGHSSFFVLARPGVWGAIVCVTNATWPIKLSVFVLSECEGFCFFAKVFKRKKLIAKPIKKTIHWCAIEYS